MSDELKLIAPTVELEESYRSYVAEAREADDLFVPWVLGFNADKFPALIARLHKASEGRGIPKTFVPHTTFWTIDASRQIVGVANIRHELNEHLLQESGHIGYSIRPSRRGCGLATRQLALALAQAGRMGIRRVLVVCEQDNPASARVIEKNGGLLENEVFSEEAGKMVRRYWIEL